MNDYINKTKDLFNRLNVKGDTRTLKDQVMYLIGGLDYNYRSLITTLTYKKRILSFKEVFIMMHACI